MNTPVNQAGSKRKKVMLVFLSLVTVTGVVAGGWELLFGRYSESTDNAYVSGDMVTVSSQLTGNVKRVAVDDNQTVEAGQLLVELDDTDTKVALEQAQAQLTEAVRTVQSLFDQVNVNKAGEAGRLADIAKAQEDVNRFSAELARVQADLSRREAAFKQGAVSAEELEHARTASLQAQSQVSAAKSAFQQAQAGLVQAQANLSASLNQTRNVQVANHPKVLQAAAQLRMAYVQQQRTRIDAPVAGQVAKRSVQAGVRTTQGAPLMSLVALNGVWVDANFKEGQLPRVRIGQPVTLRADVYGSSTEYRGTVAGLSAGTGSAFALLPAQNATGNWIKIVQRVPVRITLNPEDLKKAPLRVGLSMHVDIDTHEQTGDLVAKLSATDRSTQVFDKVAQEADAFVQASLKKALGE